jgi:TetR/AcrR family transcriptional regulator, transcriptional repressor for nem operon
MPRRSVADTAQSRQDILTSASRLMRERGYAGVGIDAITADAGLTVGAFYTHFSSKDALFAAVVEAALDGAEQHLPPIEKKSDVDAFVRFYLSDAAVRNIGAGCVVAAMSADLGRDGGQAKRAAAAYIELIQQRIQSALLSNRSLSTVDARDEAWRIVAQTIGSLVIARIFDEPKTQKAVLKAGKVVSGRSGG